MKIAYITAGAAGMYCGSCMHDNTLVNALQKQGVDAVLIPTYTPLRTDEQDVSIPQIFFGGINVYLQQKIPIFRYAPAFVDRWLARPALLNWVSKFSASTSAADLGALTLSMLRGEQGRQKKELDKLVTWLRDEFKPDLVQITNSMFAGFARSIKRELGVPVVCALQGEDLFLEDLTQPWKDQALAVLRERAADPDGFLVNSQYYRDFMADYLRVDPRKIKVIPLGLNLQEHGDSAPKTDGPFTVGYLARICPEKGAHHLLEAFIDLAQRVGPDRVRLKIAGFISPNDRAFVQGLHQTVARHKLEDRVEIIGEVDRSQKLAFYGDLNVFSVPAPYKEPKGLYLWEALANGIPVVQPAHGAFPEMIEASQGGILVTPDRPKELADGLFQLYQDPELGRTLGAKGKLAIQQKFTDEIMASNTLAYYRTLL